MKNSKILHIIACTTFTSGYINFMMEKMNNFEHKFIVIGDKFKLKLSKEEFVNNVINIKQHKEVNDKKIKKLIFSYDKIIISGVSGVEKYMFLYPRKIWKKTYLQFWGGDFYSYRKVKFFSKTNVHKILINLCIRKCGGIINLIDDDYYELCKVFPNKTKHFTGIMPSDPNIKIDYKKYLGSNRNSRKILIGNSSTKENYHIEILEKLAHLKNENLEIVCPLSYGDKQYAEEVINFGKSIFNEKFVPITEFMSLEEYMEFLSTCEIGIFNNNRQQAMGNINAMLRMGKKLYLREDTSMWKDYIKNDLKIYPISELENIKYEDLFEFEIKESFENYEKMIFRDKKFENGWDIILND